VRESGFASDLTGPACKGISWYSDDPSEKELAATTSSLFSRNRLLSFFLQRWKSMRTLISAYQGNSWVLLVWQIIEVLWMRYDENEDGAQGYFYSVLDLAMKYDKRLWSFTALRLWGWYCDMTRRIGGAMDRKEVESVKYAYSLPLITCLESFPGLWLGTRTI